MLNSLQNPFSLLGRALIALLFIPAGFGKIAGFAGTASGRFIAKPPYQVDERTPE